MENNWGNDRLSPASNVLQHEWASRRIHHAESFAKGIRVLVIAVDDADAAEMLALQETLTAEPLQLEVVVGATEGLAKLQHGNIDAVIVSLDDFRLVHRWFSQVPLIILAEAADEELAIQGLRDGAQDLLIKRHWNATLLDRMVRYGIERHYRRELEKKVRATQTELELASGIQKRLCPTSRLAVPGFDFAGAYHSAFATCGDWFDYLPPNDGRFGIVIGDVSGKGMGPAIVATETRAILRSVALFTSDLGEILTHCNQQLFNDLADFRFVTLFFAQIDAATRCLSYVGAGHRAFIVDKNGHHRFLESTCVPLGFEERLTVAASPKIQLWPGDVLVSLTDGVEEATSAEGEAFGIERVLDIVRRSRGDSAEKIADRLIYDSVVEFTQDATQDDDFTAIVLKVDGDAAR